MSKTIQSCLSSQVIEQIERNDVSPDELITIEEHVSECSRCRELFDSHYTSSQWSELIQPALSDAQVALTSVTEDGADHSAAILKLLGPTDDPNMLGRIGNYEIVGVIGQGGMGAVFKGFDRSLNRFVALKMLLPHLAASGAARKRFAREGQAVAAVVDDHVMAIHCVDQWQGIPYLVMTYSRGVSLQKRLNDSGPLELREILRIGMQAAKGLAAAHAQGIVHRDIKPSNILLDQNVERVQLVDFGLARAVDDASLTCSGTLAGTPQYMSPEQARAETVDHRSDLFSLGSVLYAMCAGYAPFRADSSYSVLRLIIEKEPRSIREINSDIPDWLCAIIGKLMSKQAVDRFDSAKQVAELLEACLAHVQQPTTVPLPSSVADLALLGISTSEFNQPQQAPTSDPMAKTWRRFIGPPIAKYLAAALAAAAMILAGVVVVLELDKGTLTIKSVADNVPIRIMQGKDTVQELTVSKQGMTTRLRAGAYTVEIEADSTAYEIQGDNVTVKRGEETLVNISIGKPTPTSPMNENQVNGIQWSTYGANEGLLSGARLILPDGGVYPGQPVAVEYRLKNVSTETKKLTVHIRGNREHITIGKDNRITDSGIATAEEPIEITIEPGKEYVATSHRAVIETHGFAPGVYQVALGSAFFYPDKADPSSKHEIPHRGSISFEILAPPDATISRPLSQDIHWGKSVSGLRLGARFRSKSNNFALGSIVEADLWIANDTKQAIDCSILLPHPMDGWLFNIENSLGSTIMLERPPLISIYHPQEFFAIKLAPGEVRQITGERIEGQPDKFAGSSARFEIVNSVEQQGWGDHTIKGRLVTQGGDYSAIFNVTLQRPDIPKIRIELDSGNCPFTIGKPDSDSTGAVDRFNKDKSSKVEPQSDSLEGVWEGIHYGQGEVLADDKRLRVIVTNGKIAALTGKRLLWISDYTLESQYVPKRICYEHDGKPKRGIYEVKEDGLRLNIADLTDALPTKFGTNHPEFKRLEGAQARELVEIVLSAAAIEKAEQSNAALDDPLALVIDRFNKRMRDTHPDAHPYHQPPLTKDELIAYASWNMERGDKLPATCKAGLSKIAKQHRLPENWTIDGFYGETSNGGEPVLAFQIFLQTDDSPAIQMMIRRRFLSPPKDYSLSTATNDPGGSSLASAVKRFNARYSQAAGIEQPPLTEDEVVAAIIHTKARRDDHDVSDALFERFQNIARTRQLPEGATLEVIPTFGVEGGSTYTIWSIRLTMLQDEPDRKGWTYGFLLREQFVSVKHGDAGSIHWGQPAENGLQAGVRLFPPLKSHQLGQKISVEILIRNVLTKPITVSVPNFPSYKVEAHDKEGSKLEVAIPQLQIVGGWRSETIGDQPLSLRGWPIVLLPSTTSVEQRVKMRSQDDDRVVIFVNPETSCRLRLTVGNYASDAKGTLTTGEVDFTVDALDSNGVINGWPVPDTLEMHSFPKDLHGNWRIQNANTLTTKKSEYIDQVAVIDQNTLLLPSGGQGTLYRLSHWKSRDDNQSIEVDITTGSTDGKDSKTYQCLLEIHGDELTLLWQQNEQFSRPKNVDDNSTSITRFTLVREKSANNPIICSPLEAIEVAKRFANDDHGKSIGVKFRVESVHPPLVLSEEADRGHTKSELHLDFRPLPANFTDDQFLVVLTPEVIAQLNKLGIGDIENHFLNKEVEANGRVLSTMYTARDMPGEHFHLIVSDLQQIAFSQEQPAPESKISIRCNVEVIEFDRLKLAQLGIDLKLGDVDSQASPISLENAENFRAITGSLEEKGLAVKISSLSKRIVAEQSHTMTEKIDTREFNLRLRPHLKPNGYAADLELRVTQPDLTRPEKTRTRSVEFDCEGKLDQTLAMDVTKLFADDSKNKVVVLLLTIVTSQ